MDTYAISYIQACSSQYIVLHESSSHSLLRIKAFRSCPLSRIVVILSLALVLAGSSLASLELLEVPVADLHVAAVLVEALCEVLGGTGAVVVLLLLLGSGLGLDGSSRFGGAAAEEAADGVADGGANGDTAGVKVLAYKCVSVLPDYGNLPVLDKSRTSTANTKKRSQHTQQCWPSGQTIRGPGKPAEEEPWPWERVAEEEQTWWSQGGAAEAQEQRRWGAKERGRKSVDEAWRWEVFVVLRYGM